MWSHLFLLPDELYGDFEDLETGEKHESLKENKDEEGDIGSNDDDDQRKLLTVCEIWSSFCWTNCLSRCMGVVYC